MRLYCITNAVTGKRYIGATTMTLARRWSAHKHRCLREGVKSALYMSIRKHGVDAFSIVEIASLLAGSTVDDMFALERIVIAQEGTLAPNGYNLTEGGEGTIGYTFTPDQVQAKIGRPCSAETRAKMSRSGKGRKFSPETNKKRVESRRSKKAGGWMPDTFVPWAKGKTLSDDHKAKMKAAWTPERRAAQAARMAAKSELMHRLRWSV